MALGGERCWGRALTAGDCIGLIAPASPVRAEEVAAAVLFWQSLGYHVRLGATAAVRGGYLAGSDELRAAEVNSFMSDEAIAAVVCLRGGYGTARLLDYIDYAAAVRCPKLFIGYSDITALHIALWQRSRLVVVHGPVAAELSAAKDYTIAELKRGLSGAGGGIVRLPPEQHLTMLVCGRAAGTIIGGNLTVLASLCGTQYELDGQGCLLFIEEVGEAPYRLDRLLNQLWQNGLLQRVSGLLFGDFTDCGAVEQSDEVLRYYAVRSGKPALAGLPAGHGRYNMFLPLGADGVMECSGAAAELVIGADYVIR